MRALKFAEKLFIDIELPDDSIRLHKRVVTAGNGVKYDEDIASLGRAYKRHRLKENLETSPKTSSKETKAALEKEVSDFKIDFPDETESFDAFEYQEKMLELICEDYQRESFALVSMDDKETILATISLLKREVTPIEKKSP